MNGVEVGSALPAALYSDKTHVAQFFDVGVDTLAGCPHVSGKAILTGETFIKLTSVFEEHGIGKFGTDGNLFALKYEIRDTGPAALCGNVRASQAKVTIFE